MRVLPMKIPLLSSPLSTRHKCAADLRVLLAAGTEAVWHGAEELICSLVYLGKMMGMPVYCHTCFELINEEGYQNCLTPFDQPIGYLQCQFAPRFSVTLSLMISGMFLQIFQMLQMRQIALPISFSFCQLKKKPNQKKSNKPKKKKKLLTLSLVSSCHLTHEILN